MSGATRVWSARWLLASPDEVHDGGGLLTRGAEVVRVLASRSAVRRASTRHGRARDLGDVCLAPGLVDAHAHVELAVHAATEGERWSDFPAWIEGLLARRAGVSPRAVDRAARDAARRLLVSGTTCVGDIDSSGAGRRALSSTGLVARSYREVLDPRGPEQRRAMLAPLRRRLPARERLFEGVSPHAPYTVSADLLRAAVRIARRRGAPLAVHWAETREELAWMRSGEGPFARILDASPRTGALAWLADHGCLGADVALVHANHPERGDVAAVAESGSTIVHCPGTHAYFDREPFPLARWRRAGVPIALGTDSLASNADFDMRREMALLRAAHPALEPAEAWRMGTVHGARALGLAGRVGALAPRHRADLAAFEVASATPRALLDELTAARPRVAGVWIGARAVGI